MKETSSQPEMGNKHSGTHNLKIFISTGEISGDMHASALVRRMREVEGFPAFELSAGGSRHLEKEGAQLLYDSSQLSYLGVLANIPHLHHALKRFNTAVSFILSTGVNCVILVDYRHFNLHLARTLRQMGYRGAMIYYVVPTLWQSAYDERYRSIEKAPKSFIGKTSFRYRILREFCDLSIAIYPVGLELLDYFQVPHVYIGHPLCEIAKSKLEREEFMTLLGSSGERVIGIMPGSRSQEVKLIGAELAEAGRILKEKIGNVRFAVPLAHPALKEIVERLFEKRGVCANLLEADLRYDVIKHSELVLCKSGTAVHECAVMEKPHIIAYRIPPVHDFVYSVFTRFRLPHYGFTNLIAGREVVPELVRSSCRGERIANAAKELLEDSSRMVSLREELGKLKKVICKEAPLTTAVKEILKVLHKRSVVS